MFHTKHEVQGFWLFDYAGVEAHLEKMAAKGWRFEKIGNFTWRYKKAEPKKVKYAVTYVPEASEFDPEPGEKQKGMEEYCLAAGWEKVGSWAQMQIFCAEEPDAVPIETDEELRLSVIEKAMRKNFIPSHVAMLFVFLLNSFSQHTLAKLNPIRYFAGNDKLWLLSIILWGFLLTVGGLAYYFVWLLNAKKAVKDGLALPKPKWCFLINRVSWIVLLGLFIGYGASVNLQMLVLLVVYLALFAMIMVVVRKVQIRLKKEGASRGLNRTITLVVDVALVMLMMTGITVAIIGFGIGLDEREPMATVSGNYGAEWDIYHDELPLTTKDLYMPEDPYYPQDDSTSYEIREDDSSILLGNLRCYQRSYLRENNPPGLSYQVIEVKTDGLYNFALESFYKYNFRHYEATETYEYRLLKEDFGAGIKVHVLVWDGHVNQTDWLILTEDKIVHLESDVELTKEQLKIAVDKLVK